MLANYVGNRGTRIPYTNAWPNAFDPYGIYPGVAGILEAGGPPVPNYGQVTTLQSGAISNYNALNLTARKQFSHSFSALFNYSWSHNLDEVSNGGIFTYGDSLLGQINPLSLRTDNYGNSDYDIRQSFNAEWVVNPTFHFSNHFMQGLLSGWQYSGKWFWRTGLPFSITGQLLERRHYRWWWHDSGYSDRGRRAVWRLRRCQRIGREWQRHSLPECQRLPQ